MRLLLLVAAVLLLAGCAGTSQTGTSPTTTSTVTLSPTSDTAATKAGPPSAEVSRAPGSSAPVRPTAIMPVAPGAGPVVTAAQIDASAARETYEGGGVSTDLSGTELHIQGVRGACSSLTATLTSQNAKVVVVALTLAATWTGDCTLQLISVALTINLDQPLGTRTVILTQLNR